MKYDVFISYSSKDQKIVEGICGFLESRRIRCFVAYRDIPKGVVWARAIVDALDMSRMMLVAFSSDFNASEQVDREIELAAEDHKPILTFRLSDTSFKGAKKYYLKNINWIDAFPEPEKVFGDLYKNICKLLDIDDVPADHEVLNPEPSPKKSRRGMFSGLYDNVCKLLDGHDAANQAESNATHPSEDDSDTSAKKSGVDVAGIYGSVRRWLDNSKITNHNNADNEASVSDALPQTASVVEFAVNDIPFSMVAVRGGAFTMGATRKLAVETFDDEKPTHKVKLADYLIGQTPVTQALWRAVMGDNPSKCRGHNLPVDHISWDDCQLFIRKLNSLTGRAFRLPTEAEWEYAAKGGILSRGYLYSGSDVLDDVAWYKDNSCGSTHPVASKRPNELGIYDMSGNVTEWCSDWFGGYSSDSQINPTGPTSGVYRVARGGSWSDFANYQRVPFRNYSNPDFRREDFGLRLALVP